MGDWRNRDAASIAKVAEVVSFYFKFLVYVYFSLHITKAKSRNKQLRHYEGNWATYEILKRFFKSKRCYKKRITSVDDDDGSDLDKDVKDDDASTRGESDGESDNDGNDNDNGEGEGDDNREGEGDGNGEGEGDGDGEGDGNREGEGDDNGEENESGNGDDDGDGGKDDDNAVDSRNGKGKGKAKEGSGYTTGSKRKMPQMVRNSKKTRL